MSNDFEQSANPPLAQSITWAGVVPQSVTGTLQRWFSRLASRPGHELQVRLEERRKERARIARDLHDTLFQGFLGVSMILHSAVEKLPSDSPSKPSLNRALLLMRRVMDEGRDALLGLQSPQSETSPSLEQSLADLGDEYSSTGVRFRLSVAGRPKPLDPAMQQHIYLIAREALVNAFRHSEATDVEVEIEYLPGRFRLIVRDNGLGIDEEVLQFGRHAHWGLQGMRERAQSIGAEFRIWSGCGAGTEVAISLPAKIAANGHAPV